MNPETTLIEEDSISIDDQTLIEPSAEHVTSTTETSTIVESDESNGSGSGSLGYDYNYDGL